jgi:hypothetical protein
MGVAIKEPFAESHVRETPSLYTGAYREWELKEGNLAGPETGK